MNTATQQLRNVRPANGQRVEVIIFNFAGKEVIRGAYGEQNGKPMIDGVKLHPMRTEWRAA